MTTGSSIRRHVWRPAVLLVVALLVAGCGAETESVSPDRSSVTEVRVAILPTGNVLPMHLADTQGIFERNGLRITRTEGQDASAFLAGLNQGQYDIVMSVPTLVLVGVERGLDVQVISRIQRSSAAEPNAVWVTRDESIDSIPQLEGRTIGVPALTGVLTDSLVYLLQSSGVDRDDVKFIQMPFAAMGDQLDAGRVDAVIASIPYSAGLAARGFRIHEDVVVEAVRDASGGTIDTGMTALFASSSTFADEHPDTIKAWRKSLTEAIDYLNTHEAQARTLLQTWLKMPPEVIERVPLPGWTVEITANDLRPYVTISKAVGTIQGDPDVDALVWQGP
ncbi:ABC transporter substrate-binding protein [Rhodococcus aetherivorans]|uniref:ABC transporter substrate-binding protein n=1 Tax=Rhodococcus aetherivorans TaxID=191292 RepID=UPI001E5CE191|nr:ABC transporter substrate-binding protein [Rhodococcus aetherivorans]MDV6296170.1 ABC transporter substrate-binding protein [Rhodococcus aetherivorans]UGQ43570.1 ABC transporter substrate-binding protein [Rhodococcus aetherivorans]